MRRWLFVLWLIPALLTALPAALFGFLYNHTYWQWRDCFDAAGKCQDPLQEGVTYSASTGDLYGPPLVVLSLLTVIFLGLFAWGLWRRISVAR
jgi:hypothetical protein